MTANAKILIVDDELFNIDYLGQELEDAGYFTLSASNGLEALEKVGTEAPDLVLLDIMMPLMDGFQVLARLKANEATRDIPVIVISASNDLQSIVRGIQLGAEDYLPKPFEPILLHARITSSLEKKRLRDLEHLYLKGLEREMEIGREIQQGFLPAELPEVEGWELATYFKAAREVAGDFYDAFLLADGSLACVIGDVCGKGVGAALMMALFRSLIRASFTGDLLGDSGPLTPAQRLQRAVTFTNRYVAETHEHAPTYATLFLGLFEAESGRLTYVTAGHERPLWLSEGRPPVALRTTGPVVGMIPEACFGVNEIVMEQGDLLLMFTDGVSEAQNAEGEFLGGERLPALLTGDQNPKSVLDGIKSEIGRFVGEAEQYDDITMIAVRRETRKKRLAYPA